MREIELNDGSVITGEILSVAGSAYTIASPSLGTIQIEESKIRAIRRKGEVRPAWDSNVQVKSLQETMMSDKQIMAMIGSLQDDPEFQEILKDPGLMSAVQSGDIATLMNNPKFLKLLSNPTVQEISKRVPR
jgi:hypothetical protein